MGAIFSKKSKVSTTPSISNNNSSSNGSSGSNSIISSDLNFNLAACENDPDVKIFDSKLQQHATAVINTLTTDNNTGLDQQVCSLSFDSLARVTGSLMGMNHEVDMVILDCKKDTWKNKELLSLVEDYFKYSVQTLDFSTALNQCLKRARDRHFIIQELRSFKEVGDPLGQEFFTIFQSVYAQQVQMLRRLQLRKWKLDKKMKSIKVYRKVCNIIFCATFVAVVIYSVVAAAIAAPPVASALAAVLTPIGWVGRWFNSLWKKYE